MVSPAVVRVILVLPMVLSGCLSDGPSEDAGAQATTSGPMEGGVVPDGADNVSSPPGPVQETYYFGASTLETTIPAAGAVTMAGSYAACFVTRPCNVLESRSAPTETAFFVGPEDIAVTLWLQAQAPVPRGAFEHGVWIGSTYTMSVFHVVTQAAPAYAPGEPFRVDLTVSFGSLRPFLVPQGESLQVYLINAATHEESGNLRFLYGGDTASAVTLTRRNLTVDPLAGRSDAAPFTYSSSLSGPGFPVSSVHPDEGGSFQEHEVTVGDNATFLEMRLRQTGGATAEADLDMDLLLDGDPIAGGHTPFGTEALLLAHDTLLDLRGRTLILRVSLFSGADVDYEAALHQD